MHQNLQNIQENQEDSADLLDWQDQISHYLTCLKCNSIDLLSLIQFWIWFLAPILQIWFTLTKESVSWCNICIKSEFQKKKERKFNISLFQKERLIKFKKKREKNELTLPNLIALKLLDYNSGSFLSLDTPKLETYEGRLRNVEFQYPLLIKCIDIIGNFNYDVLILKFKSLEKRRMVKILH